MKLEVEKENEQAYVMKWFMFYFFCIFFRYLDAISDLHNLLPTFILISVISIVVVKLLISFVSSGIVSSLSYYFNQSLLAYV